MLIDFNQSEAEATTGILNIALTVAERIYAIYGDNNNNIELLENMHDSINHLQNNPVNNKNVTKRVASLMKSAKNLHKKRTENRKPLFVAGPKINETAVKALHPRLEDVDNYKMSKDKGKEKKKAERDKLQRQLKRETKAASRELRLDGQFVEQQRRAEKDKVVGKGREERNKNFAWMEGEAAILNQQVRAGGGLMSGGGIGAAKIKAKSNKIGRKKSKDRKF